MELDSKIEEAGTKFFKAIEFQHEIDAMVEEGYELLDAIISFCDDNDIDFGQLKSQNLLSEKMKEQMRQAFVQRGMMQDQPVLPI